MVRRVWMGGVLGLLLMMWLSIPAHAAIKVIVDVGLPFYCDAGKLPNAGGPNVCVRLDLYPFGLDARSVTEAGARTALVASTSCAAIKGLISSRALAEYSAVVTAEEILVRGCTQ
jgi:hypothetical protein